MDQVWARQAVLKALEAHAELGGPTAATLDVIQELGGIGPTDAGATLALLVEEGKVTHQLAGSGVQGYRLLTEEEAAARAELVREGEAEPDPPVAYPSDGEAAAAPSASVGNGPQTTALLQQLAQALAANGGKAAVGEPRELRLTSAVAQAIDSDTLGAMVLAGVIEAGDARAEFRLVVVP